MDIKVREAQTKADNLKAEKNKMSSEIGKLMKENLKFKNLMKNIVK